MKKSEWDNDGQVCITCVGLIASVCEFRLDDSCGSEMDFIKYKKLENKVTEKYVAKRHICEVLITEKA